MVVRLRMLSLTVLGILVLGCDGPAEEPPPTRAGTPAQPGVPPTPATAPAATRPADPGRAVAPTDEGKAVQVEGAGIPSPGSR